jgi:hypothetical protein
VLITIIALDRLYCVTAQLLYIPDPTQSRNNLQVKMTNKNTAIVLIDPYNEFLHQEGKLNPKIRDSLQKTDTIANLHKLLGFARSQKISIFYCLHQQSHERSMQGWTMMNASLTGIKANKVFQEGSWGVDFYDGMAPDVTNGDVVISKHWNSRYGQHGYSAEWWSFDSPTDHVLARSRTLISNTNCASAAFGTLSWLVWWPRLAWNRQRAMRMRSECSRAHQVNVTMY